MEITDQGGLYALNKAIVLSGSADDSLGNAPSSYYGVEYTIVATGLENSLRFTFSGEGFEFQTISLDNVVLAATF